MASKKVPETRYARAADGVFLAYQVVGGGPVDIVVEMNPNLSNVDLIWEEPAWRQLLLGMLDLGRLVLHDRRGLGVSSRNVVPPNLETRASDLVTVLDAAGVDHAFLAGGGEGGAMHAVFAATFPERVSGLLWNGPTARMAWAPDYPWGSESEELQRQLESEPWGTTQWMRDGLSEGAASRPDLDDRRVETYAKIARNSATPDVAAKFERIWAETDVRAVLSSVHAPAILLIGDQDNVAEAEYVASLMPNARLHVVPGSSLSAIDPLLSVLRTLVGAAALPVGLDTVLATVMFTDIVDSTARQAAMGDRAWKALINDHHDVVRDCLQRWRGVENDTAGDGFYASFDGPARAVRCALEIVERLQPLGVQIRAGIHTGECELIDGKHGGLTVTIGSRIAAIADPSEVVVSQTVKDLVAGSGLSFGAATEHHLKGVPGTWNLYQVIP